MTTHAGGQLPPSVVAEEVDPLIGRDETYETVSKRISDAVLTRPVGWPWLIGVVISGFLTLVLIVAVTYLVWRGVGIWGINIPIAWGFAITNFVWWIGIGHAGTLISAILLLLRQDWRTSINRFAEAMTLFAVMCAGMFPLLHLGRPWFFFWLLPYPNHMLLWPQFRSPLVWDVFAVGTYFTISLIFWYVGLIPDLAMMRDRATRPAARVLYGILAMGWRGSARHWHRFEVAYLLLAGLATPLVVSVHTVVSFDFAIAQLPGWHTTIFPPYFVAGAIYSGFAMVITLAVPIRLIPGFKSYITTRHLENMAKVMLATGLILAYGYFCETFMAFYGHNKFERFAQLNRMFGPYAWSYWMLIACNVAIPQLLWLKVFRTNVLLLFLIAMSVNFGMWLERFVIIITSLHRDFLPTSWGMYYPTIWDWATLFGSIGFFVLMMLLFVRLLPPIPAFELRDLVSRRLDPKAARSGLANLITRT